MLDCFCKQNLEATQNSTDNQRVAIPVPRLASAPQFPLQPLLRNSGWIALNLTDKQTLHSDLD